MNDEPSASSENEVNPVPDTIENSADATPQYPTPETSKVTEPEPPKKKSKKWLLISLASVLLGAGLVIALLLFGPWKNAIVSDNDNSDKTTIVYAVHWLQEPQVQGIYKDGVLQSKGLKQYLDEYTALHPDIEFAIQQISYDEYANKLKVLNDSGAAPDIYQIYSQWGVDYVKSSMLDVPPADIIKDVQENYISTSGVEIDGTIWGIPTEINNFALLYNKKLFIEAGLVDASGNVQVPQTWAELRTAAQTLTKRDSSGAISQYGFAFTRDNDWQVVDPFLSLMFSNDGQYLSDDLSKSLVNSSEGIAALDAEVALFNDGSTDANGNFFDFQEGKVGMVISPPWTKSGFATSFGEEFESTVGVAPMPYMKKPSTLQYSWFMGVMNQSQNKQESWDFLKWFSSDIQETTGTTRYGDLLANNIGAIPARKVDFEKHNDVLGDFFTSVFVDQMSSSVAEPNVLSSSAIKTGLMQEIQAAWDGTKTSGQALDAASAAIDAILEQNKQ